MMSNIADMIESYILRQLAARAPLYEAYADAVVDVSGREIDDVVEEIASGVRRTP